VGPRHRQPCPTRVPKAVEVEHLTLVVLPLQEIALDPACVFLWVRFRGLQPRTPGIRHVRPKHLGHVGARRHGEQRCLGDLDQIDQTFASASGIEPIGHIVVRQDHYGPVSQELAVMPLPLAGTARVARRQESQRDEAVHVLFALRYEDDFGRIGCDQLVESVEHSADVLDRPRPASTRLGHSLPKGLGLHPDDLEEQIAALVAVVVGLDDPPAYRPGRLVRGGRHQIRHSDPQGGDHGFGGTAGMAPQQRPHIASHLDRSGPPAASQARSSARGQRTDRPKRMGRGRRPLAFSAQTCRCEMSSSLATSAAGFPDATWGCQGIAAPFKWCGPGSRRGQHGHLPRPRERGD